MLHSRMWHRAFHEIEFGRVPVVAALKGAVIGGGLELALAAHLRVAETSAFYALPEGQRGIFVGGGASVRLPRLIGVSRMRDMMLTGRVHDAESGERLGISHYVVPPGEGLERAVALANTLPVKLLFPLVICFLPGLFVATLGPVFLQFVQFADTVTRNRGPR